jgi:hypothetical protein
LSLSVSRYLSLKSEIIARGYDDEIRWAEDCAAPENPETFALEACWVVLNAGMKEQVARGIWERIRPVVQRGEPIGERFRHLGKRAAIEGIYRDRASLFERYKTLGSIDERLSFLESLPWIGGITKFHLARNLGEDVCKPDRHLERIAPPETPREMCERIAEETGDRVGVVDCVVWRAANLGLI